MLRWRVRAVRIGEPKGDLQDGVTVVDGRSRPTRLARACVLLAGSIAEGVWHRQPFWIINGPDKGGDLYRAKRLFKKVRDRAMLLDLTRLYVYSNKKIIDRVARALVIRDLAGAEVRKLIAGKRIKL